MGPASAFHFLDPAFYVVFMILPTSFGLLGIDCAGDCLVCASGLVRGRSFSPRFQSWFVCCWCFSIRARFFFSQTQAREQYLLLEEVFILRFFVCLLVVLIPVSIWWQSMLTRESVRSQFR